MKRLICFLVALLIVLLTGVLGYHGIEGWSFLDSVYMTVITLTTTGFKEVNPLSDGGKFFTIGLLMMGLLIVTFAITKMSQMIIEGEFEQIFGRKKLEAMVQKLSSHVIICGYGKMARHIADELKAAGRAFVIIEQDENVCKILREKNLLYVKGNVNTTEGLKKAGIEKASAILPVMTDDATNLFVTISARSLNSKIKIIATVTSEENRCKFMQVGADKIISPFQLSSMRIVSSILNPTISDLLEIPSDMGGTKIQVAELAVGEKSFLLDKTIADSNIRSFGVIVAGVKKQDGTVSFPPEPRQKLENKDILIVIGEQKGVEKLINLV
ncbi:MAG: potassium channel protein [Oligoflexia bacterium]|nr:potassium channel protein [Oligoflexia bacterium]